MSKSEQISRMTDIMARFVGYTGKVLPDDVTAKLQDLHKKETSQLADVIFTTMIENQRLAKELDRPSCQDTGVIQFLTSFVKTALYFLLIVSIAVRFGIKESSIAALLASGGVAIGLALQGGLSNLAGGVIIMLLRPFTVGDYIIENTNSQEGTVVKIDLFYTTLSTVDNRRITIPNGNITNSSIVNVTSQDKRKLEIKVMIGYQSDLKKAKGILETLLHADPAIMSEQEMLVFVDELADDGVILGLRAWVKTEDYWPAKWRLNEEIKLTFDEEDIDIPYPQLDVHIKSGLPETFGREERSL